MAREHESRRGRSAGMRACPGYAALGVSIGVMANSATARAAGLQRDWVAVEKASIILTGVKMIGALALILGLLLLSLHFFKRWRPGLRRGNSASQLQILDARMLAPKKSVVLVEVAGERLLLGVGTDAITLLSKIGSSVPAETDVGGKAHEDAKSFAKRLKYVLSGLPHQDEGTTEISASPWEEAKGDGEIGGDGAGAPGRQGDAVKPRHGRRGDPKTRRGGDKSCQQILAGPGSVL